MGAKETAAQISFDYDKATAYCKIAEVQVEMGDRPGARERLLVAKTSAEKVGEKYYRTILYRKIARLE